MNTGGVITAVGGVLVAIFTGLGAWFAKKGDRNAKLTKRYFDDAEFNINMVSALRADYWGLYRVLNVDVSGKWHTLIEGLPRVCSGNQEGVQRLMDQVGEFPKIPTPVHVEIERAHMSLTKRGGSDEE